MTADRDFVRRAVRAVLKIAELCVERYGRRTWPLISLTVDSDNSVMIYALEFVVTFH